MPNMILDRLGLGERRELKQTIYGALAKLTGDGDETLAPPMPSDEIDMILSGEIPVDKQFDAKALQNRDRSRQAYVMQMQKIAANPDYDRISISKTPDTGAPMVFTRGVHIAPANSGRQETITMSDGKSGSLKVPSVYAIVEAKELLASHDAGGNKAEGYGGAKGIMALNNGRTAALKQAYKQGTAEGYRKALIADEANHGISRTAIENMSEPVLVRVFSESAISHLADPGAASNVSAGAALSASEQAETDAKKLDDAALMQYQGGDVNSAGNRDFVRAFIRAMGGSDAVGDMQTADGMISADGMKRIEGALVAKAYGDNAILNDLTESPDSELKSLGNVLKDVAGRWAVMASAAKDGAISKGMDITPQLNEAITLIRKARQQGKRISELVNQNDMFSGQTNPVTEALLRLMFRGDDMSRVRSADKIMKALHGFLDQAMSTTDGADMFGHKPDPMELIAQQKGNLEADEQAGKAQKGLFDSVAEYFDGWCIVFDSVGETLSLIERRNIKKQMYADIALLSGDVALLERRKIKARIMGGWARLSGDKHILPGEGWLPASDEHIGGEVKNTFGVIRRKLTSPDAFHEDLKAALAERREDEAPPANLPNATDLLEKHREITASREKSEVHAELLRLDMSEENTQIMQELGERTKQLTKELDDLISKSSEDVVSDGLALIHAELDEKKGIQVESNLVRLSIPAQYNYDFHKSMLQAIYDNGGMVALDDVKAAFLKCSMQEEETKALLAKLKNKELEGIAGGHYRNEKKDRLVSGAYDRMLTDFAYFSAESLSYMMGSGERYKAIRRNVDALKQEDLVTWAEKQRSAHEDRKARIAEIKQAIADPRTLDDFEVFFRYKGKDKLTPEQLALYDALSASRGIEAKAEKADEKNVITTKASGIPYALAQATHAKKGIPLYIVRLTGDKLEKTAFYDLAGKAKTLGGWYSSYKGMGAIPGFQFTSEDDRTKFVKLLDGEAVDVSDKVEEREAEKQDSRIDKLLSMAQTIEDKANQELNRDRNTNTLRRARMAGAVEDRAREALVYAQTMRQIAEKTKEGKIQFIANLSQQTQLDTLFSIARNHAQKYAYDAVSSGKISKGRDAYESGKSAAEMMWNGGATPEQINEMMAGINMPVPKLTPADMMRVANSIKDQSGYKQIAQRLEKMRGYSSSDEWKEAIAIPMDMAEKLVELYKSPTGSRLFTLPWGVEHNLTANKRLVRMGIETDAHLRMALRELMSLKSKKQEADPLKMLERKLQGTHKELEWFNTPDSAAKRVVMKADLSPSHKILEPSAGLGHLADAAVSLGIPKDQIDCVEIASQLAEGLKLKGYNVVHQADFLSYTKGGYDRIIMNPPFSGDKDIEHVMHAFKLLAPGGRLVAIVSGMTGDRQNRTNQNFREFLDEHGIDEEKLPEGTFKASINSTGVNTKIIVLDKRAGMSTEERADAEGETLPKWFVAGSADDVPATDIQAMADADFDEAAKGVTGIRLLFLEAKRYGMADDKIQAIQKSASITDVAEAVTLELDGLRMKAEQEKIAAFGEDDEAEPEQPVANNAPKADPDFLPTHETVDGTPVVAHEDEPGVWVDAFGAEYEDENATPIPDAGNAKPEPPANEPLPKVEYLDAPSGGKNFGRINEQAVEHSPLLKDFPIRVQSFHFDAESEDEIGASMLASEVAKAKFFGESTPQKLVKLVSSNHAQIYRSRHGAIQLVSTNDKGISAVVNVSESDNGAFYEFESFETGNQADSALRGSKLIWEYSEPKADEKPALPFVTFNKPFSPQKLHEKTNIWNSRGRQENVYESMSDAAIAELWAWMKFANALQRYPQYRHYSWDTDKSLTGGLRTALMQSAGQDHINEVEKALKKRGIFDDVDGSYLIDFSAIQKWIDKKNGTGSSAMDEATPEDSEPTPEPETKPLASSITSPDAVQALDLSSGMNDSLDPNSPNYKFRDTGYIAGSKKEQAAARIKAAKLAGELVRSKDIEWESIEENPREAAALITKANLLGKPDWQALKDSGMTPQAAFLIDKVYRSIAKAPENDSPAARKAYAMGIESIRDRLEKLKTPQEVADTLWNELREEFNGSKLTAEEAELLVEIRDEYKELRRKYDSLGDYKSDEAKELRSKLEDTTSRKNAIWIAAMQRGEQSPESAAWKSFGKRFEGVLKYRYSNTGSSAFYDNVTMATSGKPDNWDWAISTGDNGDGKTDGEDKKPKVSKFKLTASDSYERKGGRNVGIDSTVALKEAFGLRDVQSGNYVLRDKASAEFHTVRCAEAFADLADVIGVDDKRISMGGRLAIAFGARGSGNSLAHYEPVHRVINMTKMSGGGSLAHEWFHAFDNLLVEYMGEGASKARDFLTDNPAISMNSRVRSAFEGLRSAMTAGEYQEEITIAFTEEDVRLAGLYLKNPTGSASKAIAAAKSVQESINALESFRWGTKPKDRQLKEKYYRIAAAHHGDKSLMMETALVGSGRSKFYRDAQKLDGNREKPYWSTMLEMAARAFSAYTEDKLRDQGRKNDYLSNHSSNDVPDYVSSKARPFPEGDERKRINAAFDALFKSLKDGAVFDSLIEEIEADYLIL